MRPRRSWLLALSVPLLVAATLGTSCKHTASTEIDDGGQSFAWVNEVPTSCTGQTFFEASTYLCPSGVTYLKCDYGEFIQYACAPPGAGWVLEMTSADPVASGPQVCSAGSSPDGGPLPTGTIYVEGNIRAPDENVVLQYRYCGGALLQAVVARYPTGGSGAFDLSDDGILDADQQLVLNADKTLLFAINQGSDTIAAFHVAADGGLTTVTGSPFPSGGTAPASLGVSGNILVVANKADDGIRNLKSMIPNYTTFVIGKGGSLTPTGHTFALPLQSCPTQVYVAAGGTLVFGTEETGVVRALQLSSSGELTLAPGSPVPLPASLFAPGQKPNPVWPAGLSTSPKASMLYTGIPNYGSVAVLRYTATGELTYVAEEADPKAYLPCWSVVSADGHRLYFANAKTDNLSVWDIEADPEHPKLQQTFALPGGGNPWALSLDPTGTLLFAITPRQISDDVVEGKGQLLHGLKVAADGTLSEMQGSPVPIPVKPGSNPLGVVVAADR